jgi:hypothetical protein
MMALWDEHCPMNMIDAPNTWKLWRAYCRVARYEMITVPSRSGNYTEEEITAFCIAYEEERLIMARNFRWWAWMEIWDKGEL